MLHTADAGWEAQRGKHCLRTPWVTGGGQWAALTLPYILEDKDPKGNKVQGEKNEPGEDLWRRREIVDEGIRME